MTPEERTWIEAFLSELSDVSRKHGLTIVGCGCCGSPRLEDSVTPLDPMGGYALEYGETDLAWIQPGQHDWDNNGQRPGVDRKVPVAKKDTP